MAQYFPPLIDPEATDGTELSDLLNLTFASLLSQHSGPSAPVYATAGTLWTFTGGPTWIVYIFDGAEWVPLLNVNPSTNAVSLPGLTSGAFGYALLQAANRAQYLATLQSGLGAYAGQVFVTGTASAGLGWTRNLQSLVFQAQGYSALATSHGRMRHTQNPGTQSLQVRLINQTTGQPTHSIIQSTPQGFWGGYCAVLPMNTTPGQVYSVYVEFANVSQDSSAIIEGFTDVLVF